jgi:hypothetical protein
MRLYYLSRDIFWLLVIFILVAIVLIAPARAASPDVVVQTSFEESLVNLGHHYNFLIQIAVAP